MRTLTKNAALHWATSGVRVNSLHPGFIGTAQLLERYEGTPRHEAMLANTPVGRLGEATRSPRSSPSWSVTTRRS